MAIEDVLINEEAVRELHTLADEVEMHYDAPADDAEIIRRIGTADAVLVSFRTRISRNVIESCPGIRYIGMCCTLYGESSCNVDIAAARHHGITVLGVKDYGDEGVVEYAVSELVRFLHGFGDRQWKPERRELTRQKIGIVGLGDCRPRQDRWYARRRVLLLRLGSMLLQPHQEAGGGAVRDKVPASA